MYGVVTDIRHSVNHRLEPREVPHDTDWSDSRSRVAVVFLYSQKSLDYFKDSIRKKYQENPDWEDFSNSTGGTLGYNRDFGYGFELKVISSIHLFLSSGLDNLHGYKEIPPCLEKC